MHREARNSGCRRKQTGRDCPLCDPQQRPPPRGPGESQRDPHRRHRVLAAAHADSGTTHYCRYLWLVPRGEERRDPFRTRDTAPSSRYTFPRCRWTEPPHAQKVTLEMATAPTHFPTPHRHVHARGSV